MFAVGAAWLADRPGEAVLTWQGLRIGNPSVGLIPAILAAMAVLAYLDVLRAIFTSPFAVRRHLDRRRGERAYEAISRGLIAIGSGDLTPRANTLRKSSASRLRTARAAPQRSNGATCRRS